MLKFFRGVRRTLLTEGQEYRSTLKHYYMNIFMIHSLYNGVIDKNASVRRKITAYLRNI